MAATHVPASPPRTAADWEARYVGGTAPWDTGHVDVNLKTAIDRSVIKPCRALDVGCGSGLEACWLAGQGYDITGVDLSTTAIARAERRARDAGVSATFAVGSFPADADPFDWVYDCGCFHTQSSEVTRAAFAESVAQCLVVGGLWTTICGSTDGPERDHGPPRLSVQQVATALEPRFEILDLRASTYDADTATVAQAWIVVSRRRT
ncbi:MAG: methyltransferase domain-containing protein [Nannocystaceae bacterium]|nr:methyltransferase domain-containing protein [Nannocystaceae bacterium]